MCDCWPRAKWHSIIEDIQMRVSADLFSAVQSLHEQAGEKNIQRDVPAAVGKSNVPRRPALKEAGVGVDDEGR